MRHGLIMLAAVALAGGLTAQQPPHTQHTQQAMQMQRLQETMKQMDQVMAQIRQQNQWMAQHQVQEAYRRLGREMEQSCNQLQVMHRQLEQVRKSDELQGDQDRLREMDRLQDRLREMTQQLEQAHDALKKIAGG